MPRQHQVCGFSPYETVQYKLKVSNPAGDSQPAPTRPVRTKCSGIMSLQKETYLL